MFYRLILAHLVGDFVLQNYWLVVRKRKPGGLALHVALVGLAMLPVVWGQLGYWWPGLLVILIVHATSDAAKIRLEPYLNLPPVIPFLVDQAVHVATIAAVVAVAGPGPDQAGTVWGQSDSFGWVATVYLMATYALSIALPLWLDPSALVKRSMMPRLITILVSALVLTLARYGLPMLIPVVSLGLYQLVARRLARHPVTATYPVEYWVATLVAATLGWGLL
jgi:hypothetical protein